MLTLTDTPVTPEELEFLRDFQRETWEGFRLTGLIAFADEDEDEKDEGDGSDDDQEEKPDASGDSDEEDDESAEEIARLKRENDDLKRREAKARKEQAKAERAARQKKDDERKENGEHEQMIAEKEQEIARLHAKIADGNFDRAVHAAAATLRFRDPADASALLRARTSVRTDAVDEDGEVDERVIERALKDIAKKSDYLVHPEPKKQGEVRGERVTVKSNGHDEEYRPDPYAKLVAGIPASDRSRGD